MSETESSSRTAAAPENSFAVAEEISAAKTEKIFGDDELKILLEWAKKKLEEEKKAEEEKRRAEYIARIQRYFPGIDIPDEFTAEELDTIAGVIEKFAERCNYKPVISQERTLSLREVFKTYGLYILFGIGLIFAGVIGYFLR